jgi:hypothetical protein
MMELLGANPGGNLGTARYGLGGCGIQTAALAFGGRTPSPGQLTATEEYDGSTWTAGGSLATARQALGTAGTQTAGLGFGGEFHLLLQEQQKNMMVQLGQQVEV